MPISTLQTNQRSNPISSFLLYFFGILGVAAFVYVGGNFVRNFKSLKGKSALTTDVLYASAKVLINGQEVGNTPFESKDITPGENKITLKGEKTQYETSINFLSNFNKNIHNVGIYRDLGTSDIFSSGQEFWFEKNKSGSTIRIVSNPSGASVYVDGTEIGKTPFSSDTLTEDSYDLRVSFPGYEEQTARINIKNGYTLNISLKLFPIPVLPSVSTFAGSPNLYDLSSDNQTVTSDTKAWVDAILYWIKTRNLNLDFDYYVDYKGNTFSKTAELNPEKWPTDIKKGAYLGRISDGAGLTKEAKEAFLKLTGGAITTGKKALIKETGTGWLNVRDGAGGGTILTKVDVGKTFDVLEEKTGWIKIKVDDKIQGYVSAQYVTISESK